MLLRRVIEHVKAQNWTAVALDFIIVVMGVFIGIQVANWNASLDDRRRTQSYIDRLTQDMEINRQSLIGRQESYASQIENGLTAMDATAAPTDREEAWTIIRSYFQASHAFTITLQRGAYDEIISSGDLALLDDQELVDALSSFYTFGGFATIDVIPDYRENIRRVVPFRLQQYLQTQCYEVTLQDSHFLLDCPPPDDAGNLIELAAEIQADDSLRRDLRYMLSYAGVAAGIAGNRTKRAEEVLAILSAHKGTKGS